MIIEKIDNIQEYLQQHEQKEMLRFITCGSVDDGKSTLIGRLLHDSKMIFEDHLAAITRDSTKHGTTGTAVDLALLVDGLQSEREQGITIDVAYRFFATEARKYIIADTPGHAQYTRNMATGASTADVAILLIDARYGVQTQTRRHSYICALLGIQHFVVAINKMDLVEFSENKFLEIKQDYENFLNQLNQQIGANAQISRQIHYMPMSALNGDNVVNPSHNMPWYTGAPLLDLLDTLPIVRSQHISDLRFPVQYVNRPNLDFRGFCGTLAAGIVEPGTPIKALPSGKTSRIKAIVTWEGEQPNAHAGQAVTLTLEDEIDISRGDFIVAANETRLNVQRGMAADVVWMHETPLQIGKLYDFKIGTQFVSGQFLRIQYQTDVNTLVQSAASELGLNGIARCEIQLTKPVAFDLYADCKNTGNLIIIDRLNNLTLGAGMIREVLANNANDLPEVTARARAARLGQKAVLIHISGNNAENNAKQLECVLFARGFLPVIANQASAIAELLAAGLVVIAVEPNTQDVKISIGEKLFENNDFDGIAAYLAV